MSTFKRIITFIVPTSIIGLSWFWWKWKNRLFLQDSVEEDGTSEVDVANIEVMDEAPVYVMDEAPVDDNLPIDTDSDQFRCLPEFVELVNVEKLYEDITNTNQNIVVEDVIQPTSITENECSLLLSTEKAYEDSECSQIDDELIRYSSNDERKEEDIEETVLLYSSNNESNDVDIEEDNSSPSDSSPSDSKVTEGRSNSIVSQISVDCDEGLHIGEVSPRSNTSSTIEGKRLRNLSSCGDSAIVEDYSSDALSMTGSESAMKCSESEVSENPLSPQSNSIPEEQCCKKASKDSSRTFRDWYGDWDGPKEKERREKPRHWGSLPVSDSDSDGECILKRSAKIGSVSLDKLSIALGEELAHIKSSENETSTKGRYSKQRRRNRRKSESKSSKRCTPKQSPAPKTNDSGSNRQQRRGNGSPKKDKDMDKPWRKDSGGRKSSVKLEVSEKRETVEYEFPDDMCGRLIGKSGRHISEFKEQNGVDICIECELHGKSRVVSITGLRRRIKSAEKILNERFHDSLKLITYPDISELVKNLSPAAIPVNTDLNVIVTAIVDVARFYIQIYDQNVDEKLTQLQLDLGNCYTTPRQKYIYLENELPEVGDYTVSFIDEVWCRLKVLDVFAESRVVDAFFVDYGGNVSVSVDHMWKMRPDVLQTPAQAMLFHLNNIVPIGGDDFLQEANDAFFQFSGGKVLQAFVESAEDDGPYVRLSFFDEASGEIYSINDQMVLWGLAQYETIPDFTDETILTEQEMVGSLDDVDPLEFLQDHVPADKTLTLQFLQDVEENTSSAQLKHSILNSNAPQFICAS